MTFYITFFFNMTLFQPPPNAQPVGFARNPQLGASNARGVEPPILTPCQSCLRLSDEHTFRQFLRDRQPQLGQFGRRKLSVCIGLHTAPLLQKAFLPLALMSGCEQVFLRRLCESALEVNRAGFPSQYRWPCTSSSDLC